MQKKSCAVIDIGSSKITAVVAESGVNKTFLIKARRDYEYDGFADGEFFDVEMFKRILSNAGNFLLTSTKRIDTVYVGVPGDFTEVLVKDSQLSFNKKKKINENDIDSLFEGAFVSSNTKYTLINRSAIVYELDDYRRLANPVGSVSEILKGKLSFIIMSNYLFDIVKPTLLSTGFNDVEFVSSSLAEAMYLIDAEVRDRIAMFLDVGYITTTFSLIQGDGILFQRAFNYGGGYITAQLTQNFSINFTEAEELKRKVNLSKLIVEHNESVALDCDKNKMYNLEETVDSIKASLDELSSNITDVIEMSGYAIPNYVPLKITGGGLSFIRGAKEYLSGKLKMSVEVVAPQVPLMDKPTDSSLLSLLNITIEQNHI